MRSGLRKLSIVGVGICFFFGFNACRHQPLAPDTPVISFSTDVQPLIIGNCTQSRCHGTENPEAISLMTYDDLLRRDMVVAGKPFQSNLYLAITHRGGTIMPPDKDLTPNNIQTIELWILQGAKNN